jgi:deazaflavin-dependent oxidoreductase (nitroreductase family)
MGFKERVNAFSATPLGSWVARRFIAPIDPIIYKLSGGRLTAAGIETIPQLRMEVIGRKSGKKRSVQLGCIKDGNDYVVVASNFGGTNHPAWSFNIDANPDVTVQVRNKTFKAIAERTSEEDKAKLWPKLCDVIPQYKTYVKRTDRNIKVYRLKPKN